MSLGDSIQRGALWVAIGRFSDRALEFAFGVVLARLLAPADFGLLVTVQIYTGFAGFFVGGGMSQALIQGRHIDEADYRFAFTWQVVACTAIYLVFYLLAPWFAAWYGNPVYTDLFRVAPVHFLMRPFFTIPKAVLQRGMRFKEPALIDTAGTVVSGSISIALAREGFGVWSLVAGGLATSALSLLPLFLLARWWPAFGWSREGFGKLAGYGFRDTLINLADHLRGQLPNFFISRRGDVAVLGIWNKADSLHTIPAQLIGGSLYQPLFRGVATVQGDLRQAKYLYLKAVTTASIYTFPFYVGMYWLGRPFVSLVYGEAWADVGAPLRILALAGFFLTLIAQSRAVLAAQNQLGKVMAGQLETIVILGVGIPVLLPWGIEPAAWGYWVGMAYLFLRLTGSVLFCLRCRMVEWIAALSPALALNLLLAGWLWGVDQVLVRLGWSEMGLGYFALMTCSAAGVYAIGFLRLPFASTKMEVQRWKRLLGFPDTYQKT